MRNRRAKLFSSKICCELSPALAHANPRELRLRSRIEDAGLCARRFAPDEILGADPQVRTNRHFRCAQSAPGACASFALTAASAPPHRAARLAFESDFAKCHGRLPRREFLE